MRISVLLPGYMSWPVGSYRQFFEYANRLSARGHRVTLVIPGTNRRHWAKAVAQPVARHIRRARMFPWFDVLSPKVGIRYVFDRDDWSIPATDILVFTGWETTRHYPHLRRCTRATVQFVLDYAFWAIAEPERKRKIESGLSNQEIPVVAGSLVIAAMLEGLGRHAMDVVLAGVDTEVFRSSVPLAERGRTIGMLPRPSPVKGSADGIAALALLRESGVAFRAIAVSHNLPDDLPAWVECRSARDDEAMTRFYNECSIFLHPSRFEGLGLPALEAMACGAAVVSTDNGGVRDFARPGENLLLAPVGDPKAIAGQVRLLLDDAALRERIAHNGLATAPTFNWDKPVDQLEAVFASLLS